MALNHLPAELLTDIIRHALPEGFQGMALTCQRFKALCEPFIGSYNRLYSEFNHFSYRRARDPTYTIKMAFDLIGRIAVEPIVARYIRTADFTLDSVHTFGRPGNRIPDVRGDSDVVRLFADSPYLKQAGLDWREYYTQMDIEIEGPYYIYSQLAATFLLTLLPSVETLVLPTYYKPMPATTRLINAVVRKAQQSHDFSFHTSSLAQTTEFWPTVEPKEDPRQFDLAWARIFLALPHVRSFNFPGCVAFSKDRCGGWGATLTEVNFHSCHMDEVDIAEFLKHTVCLKKLRYSHAQREDSYCRPTNLRAKNWDICKFVTAIQREAGSHLEELSISILRLRDKIARGRASMRAFRRLRELELPLAIAICNIIARGACRAAIRPSEPPVVGESSTNHYELEGNEPFLSELVPSSVSWLSLNSRGKKDHAKALDLMFRHFTSRKGFLLPALKEIWLSYPADADNEYKEQCAKLLTETERAGVRLFFFS